MIVCGEANSDVLDFPPVVIIEILSPYNLKNDRVTKFEIYRENGVKYYLMVNVQNESIEIYPLVDNFYKQVDINTFQLNKNCEISFDFKDVWV